MDENHEKLGIDNVNNSNNNNNDILNINKYI